MEITLLGSGDAIGMPVPMCRCEYCQKTGKRRRSGLLVQDGESTLVLDISPDIKEQLHHEKVYDVDAFLVTHFHYDHFWGIQELNHVALPDDRHAFNPEDFDYNGWHDRQLDIYANSRTGEHMESTHGNVSSNDNVKFHEHGKDETFEVEGFKVTTFGIEHGEEGTNQGYVLEKDGKKIVWAPDAWVLEESEAYQDADLFFVEGQLFDMDGHAKKEVLEPQIQEADADRVVLLSVTEHLNQMHTEEMKQEAEQKGYEIWSDFDSVDL